jgi:hypothetical protein
LYCTDYIKDIESKKQINIRFPRILWQVNFLFVISIYLRILVFSTISISDNGLVVYDYDDGCHEWSRNCLHFKFTWVYPMFSVRVTLFNLWFSMCVLLTIICLFVTCSFCLSFFRLLLRYLQSFPFFCIVLYIIDQGHRNK